MASLALYGYAAKQRQGCYSNEIAIYDMCRLIPSSIQISQCSIFLGSLQFLRTVLAETVGENGDPEQRQIKANRTLLSKQKS